VHPWLEHQWLVHL
jgi:hypothetical protein